MSDIFIKLLSDISGAHNLEACLNKCDITNLSDIIDIDDRCLLFIETCIKEKCSKMAENDRLVYIEDVFMKRPDIFKFAPGVRERILNTVKSLKKVYKNSEENEINEYGIMLYNQKKDYETNVPIDKLNRILMENRTMFGISALPNSISRQSIQSNPVSQSNLVIHNYQSVVETIKTPNLSKNILGKENSIKKEPIVNNIILNDVISVSSDGKSGTNLEIDDVRINRNSEIQFNKSLQSLSRFPNFCSSTPKVGHSGNVNSLQFSVERSETNRKSTGTIRHKPNKNQMYGSEELGEIVANNLRNEFINCQLTVGKHFDLIVPKTGSNSKPLVGRFACYICPSGSAPCKPVQFTVNRDHSLNFASIRSHIATHFYSHSDKNLHSSTKRKFPADRISQPSKLSR